MSSYSDSRKEDAGLAAVHQAFVDKALLSLSGGGLVLTVSFVNYIGNSASHVWLPALYTSWLLWGLCIITTTLNSQFAVWHFAEAIDNIDCNKPPDRVLEARWSKWIRTLNILPLIFFTLAALFFMTFAVVNAQQPTKQTEQFFYKETPQQTVISAYVSRQTTVSTNQAQRR